MAGLYLPEPSPVVTPDRHITRAWALLLEGLIKTVNTVVSGYLTRVLPASTITLASVNLPHGTAPTAPVDGDLWTTTAGLFVRINGVTVGPLS